MVQFPNYAKRRFHGPTSEACETAIQLPPLTARRSPLENLSKATPLTPWIGGSAKKKQHQEVAKTDAPSVSGSAENSTRK